IGAYRIIVPQFSSIWRWLTLGSGHRSEDLGFGATKQSVGSGNLRPFDFLHWASRPLKNPRFSIPTAFAVLKGALRADFRLFARWSVRPRGRWRSVLRSFRGVRRHHGPGGRYARANFGGPSDRRAIRTRLHAATTYWAAACVRSTPR